MTTPDFPIPAPESNEFHPFYGGYVEAVSGRDVVDLLIEQPGRLRRLCDGLSEDGARYRYAEGKWSIKELLVHLTDGERVFAYRTLRMARGDTTPLPGFEQDPYVEASGADDRSLEDILFELESVRAATVTLVTSLREADLQREGTASDASISVRALIHITAGHMEHHLGILEERYGLRAPAG